MEIIDTNIVIMFLFLMLEVIFIIFWSIMCSTTQHYIKKYGYVIADLNNKMNSSYSLKNYFESRDALIAHLKKMKSRELFVYKRSKYKLNEKPSILLSQLAENENLSVYNAILRTVENTKYLIRNYGAGFSDLYETEMMQYYERLSPINQGNARCGLQKLREYENIVGTIQEADKLEGLEFEQWCANLLLKNGFLSAEVTRSSGDQGVDIVAVKDGVHYAIQCKRYSSNLDNTPIQEVYAGKEMYGCQVGAVMTNQYFTEGAKALAERTRVLLWDRDVLTQMLKTVMSAEEQRKNVSKANAIKSEYTDGGQIDPLFYDSIRVILETGQASVSIIQRKLNIGYARAATIIDQLEAKGMIGPFDGKAPRKILLSHIERRNEK